MIVKLRQNLINWALNVVILICSVASASDFFEAKSSLAQGGGALCARIAKHQQDE
jgi:hypothetical protein